VGDHAVNELLLDARPEHVHLFIPDDQHAGVRLLRAAGKGDTIVIGDRTGERLVSFGQARVAVD